MAIRFIYLDRELTTYDARLYAKFIPKIIFLEAFCLIPVETCDSLKKKRKEIREVLAKYFALFRKPGKLTSSQEQVLPFYIQRSNFLNIDFITFLDILHLRAVPIHQSIQKQEKKTD